MNKKRVAASRRRPSTPLSPDDPKQSRAFIEKAREIEADEEHSAADKLMERLAKTPKSRKPAGKPSTHTPTNLKR
jgi:hypothetical protein